MTTEHAPEGTNNSREIPEERIQRLGFRLPTPAKPSAKYVPLILDRDIAYISGQTAGRDGEMVHTGVLGVDLNIEQGIECARACALNVLSHLKAALKELSAVRRVLHLVVYVASGENFTDQHLVANGASELLVDVLGDAGMHTRSSVGAVRLPRNSPVEVEARVRIRAGNTTSD